MATSTYGTPYVQGSDLVSAYPTASSNLATRVDEVSYKRNGLNAQTGTTYTLVAGDAGKTITLSNAAAVAVTLPQDSVATLPTGAVVTFYNLGAGTVTISQGTGATLQGGSITLAQYEVTSVMKLSANTYGKADASATSGLAPISPTSIANSGGTASATAGTVTFTTVNSISLNGVFSATYDNYRIVLSGTGSTSLTWSMRYRVAGSDNTNATYLWNYMYGSGTTVAASRTTSTTNLQVGFANSYAVSGAAIDVYSPFLSAFTASLSQSVFHYSSSGCDVVFNSGGFGATTSFDGFSIIPSTGSITGNIRVYGYKN